jgi:uncharacterized protein (TIGR02145 family)
VKQLLILICLFYVITANAQDYLINFAGTGSSSTVSTVKVENLTSGISLVINGNDILHLFSITTGINSIKNDPLSKIKIYPNPMADNSTIQIYPPVAGDANITVFDITGKPVATIQGYLENSRQDFKLSGLKNGFYLISVTGYNYHFSGKLLCNGNSNGAISIEKVNNVIQTVDEKVSKADSKGVQATVDMEYTSGDRLKFTGISGNYSVVKTDIPEYNKTILFNFIDCTDGDANNYPVVEIGTQVWMAENLKTTKFSDGTDIPLVKVSAALIPLTTPCYAWYRNDKANKDTRGGLYNWYSVDVASNGNKNVCPTGWHVPTYVDWVTMENYLIANGYNYDGSIIGNKIAKSLAATTSWYWGSGGVGIPGNSDFPAYRNKTGFTAIMAGAFYFSEFEPKPCGWWSATDLSAQSALYTAISFMQSSLYTEEGSSKEDGHSVRCLQGEPKLLPVLTTTAISNIKYNGAASGGNITSDGNSTVTFRGVCWSTTSNPTIADNKTINGIGTGEFTSSIHGLMPETTYYVRAYATNGIGTSYGNELIFKTYTGSVTDLERNDYNTIRIGNQVWMAENLRTTKYNDDTAIPIITDAADWSALSTPGYCWYNNDAAKYKGLYGALYNWYTIDVASNGGKNVCPTGWHVPTYVDWVTMENYLIANGYNYDGSTSGNKIAKSLAATTTWYTASQVGAPGNTDYPTYRNKTGFTAFSTGIRTFSGDFTNGNYGSWWSATGVDAQFAWFAQIWWDNIILYIDHINNKNSGYSVRCIQDQTKLLPLIATTDLSNLTQTTANSGGNVTSDGGSMVTARGVCWSTTSSPTISDSKTTDGAGTGTFASLIVGLVPNTTYYVRAYATNIIGTTYGNQSTLTLWINSPGKRFNDIDWNPYNSVKIGNQVWMVGNLKTTKFNDGTTIPLVTDNTSWMNLSTAAYSRYSSDVANDGPLYNWFAVNTGKLCPTGWHIPSNAEWTTLTTFLGGESTAGGKLKEASTTHWISPNEGATDESGFYALPGGYRGFDGTYVGIGSSGEWWSSTEYSSQDAWHRTMYYSSSIVGRSIGDKRDGFSVRCLKDN